MVERLRRVKDDAELAAIAAAAELADEIWRWSLERGLAGRSELDVAHAAEARMRELGAEPSFPTIVAAGPNGALPHAEPGEREIGRGELVVFDMGAKLDGYCSDGTRTFATGEPGERARAVYETVLEAQAAALAAVKAGVRGEDVDAVARELIDAAGHGEHFGHGLGHGVGLEVHEEPRVSPRSEDVLAPGEVVTVEPGIYLPGELGRQDRGPGRRHRGRPAKPQRPAQGPSARRLARLPRCTANCGRRRRRCGVCEIDRDSQALDHAPAAVGGGGGRVRFAGGDPRRRPPRAPARHGAAAAPLPLRLLRDPRRRPDLARPRARLVVDRAARRRLRRLRGRRPLHARQRPSRRSGSRAAWGILPLLLAGAVAHHRRRRQPGADVVRAARGHPRRPLRAARDRDRHRLHPRPAAASAPSASIRQSRRRTTKSWSPPSRSCSAR